MGSGEFGSNGSVHWKVKYNDGPKSPPDHMDYDNHPYASIGKSKGHHRKFRIVARYKSHEQAKAALEAALQNLRSNIVRLDVNLRKRRATPGSSDRWEIRVDW